jgi:hypothetical protein
MWRKRLDAASHPHELTQTRPNTSIVSRKVVRPQLRMRDIETRAQMINRSYWLLSPSLQPSCGSYFFGR